MVRRIIEALASTPNLTVYANARALKHKLVLLESTRVIGWGPSHLERKNEQTCRRESFEAR